MKLIICGTCSRRLDVYVDASGVRDIHPPSYVADHEPVPVEAPDGWRGHCDFCFSDEPVAVLPTNDFPVPHMPASLSRGDWAACGMCSTLIGADRWERLVKRSVRKTADHHEVPVDVALLVSTIALFAALRENIRGPLRPLAEEAGSDG
ncbi:hypothetical protein [Amycolatopsis sp. SB7-3]|uniref:hypothetical protein n=1 Tax=Amycolatopsis sp. SB7-3 TaxID=3373438 RepID=UPI003743E1F9